jgi:hypothetical protein
MREKYISDSKLERLNSINKQNPAEAAKIIAQAIAQRIKSVSLIVEVIHENYGPSTQLQQYFIRVHESSTGEESETLTLCIPLKDNKIGIYDFSWPGTPAYQRATQAYKEVVSKLPPHLIETEEITKPMTDQQFDSEIKLLEEKVFPVYNSFSLI